MAHRRCARAGVLPADGGARHRLRLPRRRAVLPDQRLRHLHELLGPPARGVLHLPGEPALPGVLGLPRRHGRVRGPGADDRRPARGRGAHAHRGGAQRHHAAAAARRAVRRHGLLDALRRAAVLPALRGRRVDGPDLPARGAVLRRLAHRRRPLPGLGPAGGRPDRHSGLRALLRRGHRHVPDPPVRRHGPARRRRRHGVAGRPGTGGGPDGRHPPRIPGTRLAGPPRRDAVLRGAAGRRAGLGQRDPLALADRGGRGDVPVLPAAPAHRVRRDPHRVRRLRAAGLVHRRPRPRRRGRARLARAAVRRAAADTGAAHRAAPRHRGGARRGADGPPRRRAARRRHPAGGRPADHRPRTVRPAVRRD